MGISKKSWTGFAFETVPGTAILVPEVFHPCKSKVDNKKKIIYLSEDRGSRDANTKRKQSVRAATGEIEGTFYLDTSPYLLYAFMGGITSTQPDATNAPNAYQHALTLADTPPVLTITKGYDVAGYYAAFAAVEKLSYKWAADNKLLEETAGFQSRYMKKMTGGEFTAAGTPVYSLEQPGKGVIFAGYTPTIKLDGVATDLIEEMELEFSQKLTLFFAINGSQDFVRIYYGDRDAKISFTASFDDTSVWDKYDADTDQHIEVEFKGQQLGTGPSTVFETLSFDFPIVGYDSMDIDNSKEYIQLKAEGMARPGNTLNSTFTAKVINEVISYPAA